jgi:hypothetical protein
VWVGFYWFVYGLLAMTQYPKTSKLGWRRRRSPSVSKEYAMTVMRIEIPAKKTEMFTWVVSGLQDSRVEFEAKYDEEEKQWVINLL